MISSSLFSSLPTHTIIREFCPPRSTVDKYKTICFYWLGHFFLPALSNYSISESEAKQYIYVFITFPLHHSFILTKRFEQQKLYTARTFQTPKPEPSIPFDASHQAASNELKFAALSYRNKKVIVKNQKNCFSTLTLLYGIKMF